MDVGQELYPQSLTYLCHLDHTQDVLQLHSRAADAEREQYRQSLLCYLSLPSKPDYEEPIPLVHLPTGPQQVKMQAAQLCWLPLKPGSSRG